MNDETKAAYRRLLYLAMVDIRNLCQSRGGASWNPLEWRRQNRRGRVAGALADWLHNLAHFSARNFERFDEQWFWAEHSRLCQRFPSQKLESFRDQYDADQTESPVDQR